MKCKLGKVTALDVYNGFWVGHPKYVSNPYIVVSNEGIVLAAGTMEDIKKLHIEFAGYYDNCEVEVRKYGLYMNDNTKINDPRIPICNNQVVYNCGECPYFIKSSISVFHDRCSLPD